jgi:HD-GYP domain-containing protein (c-di-GMP phosphodiesterase class II)
MIAICDAYDAITTDRPYEPAMHGADALAILKKREGHRYDQAMLETFIRMLLDPRSLRG